MNDPKALIDALGLEPHPEGGRFRETWRAPAQDGERAGGTAIYFLLDHAERSHWHRVDAAEIWLWHGGHALDLSTAPDNEGPVETIRLGPDIAGGERPQHVIAPVHWQAAHAPRGWALVSCIVVPGFEFSGFTLAPEGWSPG